MALLATILYWAGIILVICAVGYLIIGLVRKEFLAKRFFTLLVLGILAFMLQWFFF